MAALKYSCPRPFYLFFIIFYLIFTSVLPAQISFSDLDISDDNRLLFRVSTSAKQEALFISDINDRSMRQLTAFPERMDLIENGRILQVSNALGTMRIPVSGGLPVEISAVEGGSLRARMDEILVSPNGRWSLNLVPETHAYGTLVLLDNATGESIIIASRVERPDRVFPASWSPDSELFIYSRMGRLYFCAVNTGVFSSSHPADERFRLLGEGTINSIVWDRGGDCFYLRGSAIYRLRTIELFTRSLYTDVLEIGTMAGKIPFEFNPYFDSFWIAPDSRSMLLSKGGRNVFYYPLQNDDSILAGSGLPYLVLPHSHSDIKVLWPAVGGITVMAAPRSGSSLLAWRLDPGAPNAAFVPLRSPLGSNISLSPNGSMAVFWGENGIALYDYAGWRLLETVSSRPAYSCIWLSNNELITGDDRGIERIVLFPGENIRILNRDLICLSRAARFAFENSNADGKAQRILAQNNGAWYITDGVMPWTEMPNPDPRPSSQISASYRVYLENQSSGPYANLPLVRNIASVGTFSLISVPEYRTTTAAMPAASDADGIFVQGRNTGAREISLCFDLYDDAEGLFEVLEALSRRNIRATFFLGGEFIRRYPEAANDIADAGHEAASLFFSSLDLSDSRYQIDDTLIARGLARNEDEYFNATGRELALLWHPPWYSASSQTVLAAAGAGYLTIGRDIDPYDWVSREDEKSFALPYFSASDTIDRIMGLTRPGNIIPVRLGLLQGGRTDYLFQRINVLLDALLEEGYRIIPVSELVNHAL